MVTTFAQIPDRMMDTIQVRCRGVLADAVRLEIENAIHTFIRESTVWRESETYDIVADQAEYPLSKPQDSEIIAISGLFRDGRGVRFNHTELDVIQLLTTPRVHEAGALEVISILRLREGSDRFPQHILTRYHDQIVAGALFHLYSQPKKPYTDDTMALIHSRQFNRGISMAKTESNREWSRRDSPWRYPETFAKGFYRGVPSGRYRRAVE